MDTVKEDNEEQLEMVYESMTMKTRKSVDRDAYKIKIYFMCWALFTIIFLVCLIAWIDSALINETLGKKVQRTGSIIPLFALLGEFLFLIKLNALASVNHPAQLTPQIYLSRRFKILKYISLFITTILIALAAVLSGYGDLLCEIMSEQ